MRTAILADKLLEKGHGVLWWTSAFDHLKKVWIFEKDSEVNLYNGLTIKALKGIGYKKNISFSRYIDHKLIARKFRMSAPKIKKPDIIIASMPTHDLAYEAVLFGRNNDIPVLVDIRDPWPDIFLNHIPSGLHKLVCLCLYRDFHMIKKALQQAAGLTSVTKSLLEWGLKHAERIRTFNDSISHLGYKNSKILNYPEVMNRFKDLAVILNEKYIILFVGTISRSYHDPSIILKAAERLHGLRNIHFIIAGDGEFFMELKRSSRNISNISVTGWLHREEITFLLEHSKIGLCPVTKPVNLPTNKMYSYLSAGLPVISAFQGEIKEIIEKYNIGFYYPPNDLDALIKCIKKLYENKELYTSMSNNSQRVFDEMFDADKIYDEYVRHIEKIVNNFKKD